VKKVTKIIKRRTVIRALKTEPLIHGLWWGEKETDKSKYDYGRFIGANEIKPNCPVCAVGAVLRAASFEKAFLSYDPCNVANSAIKEVDGAGDCWEELLEEKNYLGALTNYFESFIERADGTARESTRRKCVEFVKKNFPKQFKLTIEA